METLSLRQKSMSIPAFYRVLAVHVLFALLKIIYIIFGRSSLFFEEAQYWLWSQHPALSYYSKPPLIAYVNYVSTGLLGDTELAIRINAVISGFIIGIIVFLLASAILRDQKKAFLSSVLLIAFPYFWIISYFFTTDSLVTLFWVWALYAFYQALQKRPGYWLWTGVAVGLGFLSKYSMVFFWPMAIVYLIIYNRSEFRRPNFYLSVLLSMLFLLPVVFWNAANEWVTVRHVWSLAGGHSVEDAFFSLPGSLKNFLEYAGGQLLLVLLPFLIPFHRGVRKAFLKRLDRVDLLIFAPVMIVLVLFALASFVTHVEVNWTFFAMPVLSIILVKLSTSDASFRWQLIIVPVLMVVFLSLPQIAWLTGLPADLNPMERVIGWEELSADVKMIMDEYEEEPMVIAESYKMASMLTFYLPDHPFVHDLSPGKRMNQFDMWKENCADSHGTVLFVRRPRQNTELLDECFGNKLSETKLGRPVGRGEVIPVIVSAHNGFHLDREEKKERF